MTINFQLTEDQIQKITMESPTFRQIVVNRLFTKQIALDKISGDYVDEKTNPNNLFDEKSALDYLDGYIRTTFTISNKIAAIKYVRQWADDRKAVLSSDTYNKLWSLSGAKEYVDERVGF